MSAGTYSNPLAVIGFINGNTGSASTATVGQVLVEFTAPCDCHIGGIQASALSAGTGAGNTVIEVRVFTASVGSPVSIWPTAGNRPTLASASTGQFALAMPYNTVLRKDDTIQAYIAAIPASAGHANVNITITLEHN